MVGAGSGRKLLAGQNAHAEPGHDDHRALHALQGASNEGQRSGDLQPRRDAHRAVRGPRHLPTPDRKECGIGRPVIARARGRCGAKRSAENSEDLQDHDSVIRRPGIGGAVDRSRSGDQRRADRGRRQPVVDAPVRLWPRRALHRVLRLDVPASAAGRRHGGWPHGHRQEPGAPL